MAGSFVNFPTQLQPMLQTGFLERELEEGLDSILAYRREAVQDTVNARIGETLTKTRKGRKTPVTTSLNPATINSNLDNGLTPSTFSIEQYSFTLANYADTVDVNLMQELAGIADQLMADSRNNGVQAAQSMDRIARNKLFAAYGGGNTRVRTDLGASTSTTCHVDDVNGFQTVLVNGTPTPVSGANTLSVTETATSGSGVNQTLTVTGVAVDVVNNSSTPYGQSGVLTFNSATAPVNLDALVAANAPQVLRPNSKLTTQLLTGGDVLTLGLCLDGVAYLRDNAVPPMADGTYHMVCDSTSIRQLFADQDFKILFAASASAREYVDGDVIRLAGITFIPTTEAFVQQKATNGSQVRVRRPIILGAEVIIQGNFEGLDSWLNREGVNPIGEIMLVNNVAQIVRPPLDRLQQNISLSWTWVGDFAVPTDITATTAIIPTSSGALFRRGLLIEHAG